MSRRSCGQYLQSSLACRAPGGVNHAGFFRPHGAARTMAGRPAAVSWLMDIKSSVNRAPHHHFTQSHAEVIKDHRRAGFGIDREHHPDEARSERTIRRTPA